MSRPKSVSREIAVQALYQWQMTGDDLNHIIQQFLDKPESKEAQKGYFKTLVQGVVEYLGDVDTLISQFVDRDLEKVDPVEKAILRIGTYELLHCLQVPYRVVINENINLAKRFGAEKSHAYVNSVLDKVAAKSRSVEMTGAARKRV